MRLQKQHLIENISVAFYWHNEGYGLPSYCSTREAALALAEEWAKDSVVRDGRAVIHVIETTKRVTAVEHL